MTSAFSSCQAVMSATSVTVAGATVSRDRAMARAMLRRAPSPCAGAGVGAAAGLAAACTSALVTAPSGPDPAIDKVANAYGRRRVEDADGATLILFDNEWTLQRSIEQEKELTFHDVQPRPAALTS